MEKPNTSSDTQTYLEFGNLTQPFLPSEYILNKVMSDYNARLIKNQPADKPESLFRWIHSNIKYSHDPQFRAQNKFNRTAKEIWESKLATGCTDYCILFATFARQLGVPTTILSSAEKHWVDKLKNGEEYTLHSGHSFCECFYNNKWILIDPTCQKIQDNYDTKLLQLSYQVNKSNEFIPYLREISPQNGQSIKEFNQTMDELCREL